MLVAKVAFSVAVLFLVIFALEARYRPRLSRVFRSSDDDRSSRAWERREEQDTTRYFEQCRFVNVWKERLGYVSVLAFLDPASQYSFRQAVMLDLLSSRLRKSGFPDVRFFMINPPDSMENDRSEDDFEVELWREIGAEHEIESFVEHDLLSDDESKITILQDDPQSRMWERFRASRDQVIIIDRCGKLAYHVIVPWSILFFPYVKAAILSTYEEDPCGGCDPTIYRMPNHEEYVVKLTKVTDEEETSSTQSKTDTNVDAIWTTESLEKDTLHDDKSSSEKEHETSTASSILFEKIANDTNRSNVSPESPTEFTTYLYNNDAIEPRFESHPDAEDTQDQKDPKNSEGSSIIYNETTATLEPQRDVISPEQTGSHPPANNSLTLANHGDRTLLDEPATEIESDSTPVDEEMMTLRTTNLDIRGRNKTTKNIEGNTLFGEDMFLPLRIIMYAPHEHKNGRKMKKHTHLILKIGDPNFHKHLDFGIASPTDSWQGINSSTIAQKNDWGTTKDAEENANETYTFDRDESPGLYGEIADYWKSYEDNDVTDRNETFDDTYNNPTTSYNGDHANVNNHTASLSKLEESYSVVNITESPNGSSIDPQKIGSNTIGSSKLINTDTQVDREEEMQYKLTEHYKKLLPWIDYRLSK